MTGRQVSFCVLNAIFSFKVIVLIFKVESLDDPSLEASLILIMLVN